MMAHAVHLLIFAGVMSTDFALEGALLHGDSGSMRMQLKFWITGPTIKWPFVLQKEYMLPGNSSICPRSPNVLVIAV